MTISMQRMIAAAVVAAAAAGAVLPASAATTPAAPPAPTNFQSFARPLPSLPPSPTQRMTENVGQMSQLIQRDIGAIYQGQDFLGAGTSITH